MMSTGRKSVAHLASKYRLLHCLPRRSLHALSPVNACPTINTQDNGHYHCQNSSSSLSRLVTLSNHSTRNLRQFVRGFKTKMAGEVLNLSKSGQFDNLFESTYHQMLEDLSSDHSKVKQLDEVKDWLETAINYNLRNGKRNRAKSLVLAFELFASQPTEQSLRSACMMGWCIELLQSYFLIVDDIMDNSITRRGQLCWYRKETVGLTAINDAIMFNNSIFFLLQSYFDSYPCYIQMVDLFNEITRYTAYGQCLDLISNPLNKKPDLSTFTDERYDTIVRYKTSYYSFCLPIRLAMYLANITNRQSHIKAEEILLRIGHLFQVQDDYLDCFGDPNVTGKIGTDIEDGKCCWLVVNALKLSNESQREVIVENYGENSEESVCKIKAIYKELGIEQHFKDYEKNEFNAICELIERIDDSSLSKDVFYNFLTMIYQRQK